MLLYHHKACKTPFGLLTACFINKVPSPYEFITQLRMQLLRQDTEMKIDEACRKSDEKKPPLAWCPKIMCGCMPILKFMLQKMRNAKLKKKIKKNEQKEIKRLAQQTTVAICGSGLSTAQLLHTGNYTYIAPLYVQLFAQKAFHTGQKLLNQNCKKVRRKNPVAAFLMKKIKIQTKKHDLNSSRIYQNCHGKEFQDGITKACTDGKGIYFPSKSFTHDKKKLDLKKKAYISHEVAHNVLKNTDIKDDDDKVEFETEGFCIQILNKLGELEAQNKHVKERLLQLLKAGIWGPYQFGVINVLSQIPEKNKNRTMREITQDWLSNWKQYFKEEKQKELKNKTIKKEADFAIRKTKNLKKLISAWDKPVDRNTARELAKKHGFN